MGHFTGPGLVLYLSCPVDSRGCESFSSTGIRLTSISRLRAGLHASAPRESYMKSIQLLPITPVLTDALRTPSAFERSYQVRLGPNADLIREVAEQNVGFMRTAGTPEEWGSYLAIDQSSRDVVGVCAYKGSPDAEAGVEIAYFTFPVFEKQGYGTASAAALVRQATESGRVRVIRAHTANAERVEPASRTSRLQQRRYRDRSRGRAGLALAVERALRGKRYRGRRMIEWQKMPGGFPGHSRAG